METRAVWFWHLHLPSSRLLFSWWAAEEEEKTLHQSAGQGCSSSRHWWETSVLVDVLWAWWGKKWCRCAPLLLQLYIVSQLVPFEVALCLPALGGGIPLHSLITCPYLPPNTCLLLAIPERLFSVSFSHKCWLLGLPAHIGLIVYNFWECQSMVFVPPSPSSPSLFHLPFLSLFHHFKWYRVRVLYSTRKQNSYKGDSLRPSSSSPLERGDIFSSWILSSLQVPRLGGAGDSVCVWSVLGSLTMRGVWCLSLIPTDSLDWGFRYWDLPLPWVCTLVTIGTMEQ